MQIPPGIKTYNFSNSTIWFDSDGIMYSVPKQPPSEDQSIEVIRKEMDELRAILGNKKVCMILESSNSTKPPRREMRDFIAAEIESVTKAMAFVTSSPLSRMIANLFFGLKPPTYPVRMFTDETEAHRWIKQYL